MASGKYSSKKYNILLMTLSNNLKEVD